MAACQVGQLVQSDEELGAILALLIGHGQEIRFREGKS